MPSAAGKTFASALLPRSLQPLSFAATRAEESEYNSAITDLISAAAKSLDASAAVGEDFAGQYLRSNSLSKLTGGLNNTSIDRLQNAIGDAWDKGGSYDQIVQAITDTFDDFSDTRAGLIAQTEAQRCVQRRPCQRGGIARLGREALGPEMAKRARRSASRTQTKDGFDC